MSGWVGKKVNFKLFFLKFPKWPDVGIKQIEIAKTEAYTIKLLQLYSKLVRFLHSRTTP